MPFQRNKSNDNFNIEPTPDEFKWIEGLTNVLDTKFKIPRTNITFGIDPIIGMIPGFGDVASYGISSLLILSMIRHGASREVVIKMLMNLGLDTIVGVVPILGGIFDVFFKANRRNYNLLKQHQVEGKHDGKGWGLIIGVSIILLIMFGCLMFGMFKLTQWVVGLF